MFWGEETIFVQNVNTVCRFRLLSHYGRVCCSKFSWCPSVSSALLVTRLLHSNSLNGDSAFTERACHTNSQIPVSVFIVTLFVNSVFSIKTSNSPTEAVLLNANSPLPTGRCKQKCNWFSCSLIVMLGNSHFQSLFQLGLFEFFCSSPTELHLSG